MAIEDVLKAVAEEQKNIESQQKTQAEAEKASKKPQADKRKNAAKEQALQQIAEKEVLFRMYVAQLASGKANGKTLDATARQRIEDAASILSDEINSLRVKANPPAPEKNKMVGSLTERQLPFQGQSIGQVTGPISGGLEVGKPTPGVTGDEKIFAGPGFKPSKPGKTGGEKISAGPGYKPETSTKPGDGKRLTREQILAKYPIIDALFEQDPELQSLLNKYVSNKKMTLKQFTDELSQAQFNFKYSDTIKQRLAEKAVYDRLGDKATGQSLFERNVAGIAASLEDTARRLGAVLTSDDLNRIASQLYLAGTEDRPLVTERALTPYIKLGVSPITGRPTVGGEAGSNYRTLLSTAESNGISESVLPKILGFNSTDEVLRQLAEGASIADYQQALRDVAMTGRSDYVKNLMARGLNLDAIISPYRQIMADTLEIADPSQIKIDDPTLMMALGDKEMTLTDFQRALRKDTRWQYTNKAREEVSDAALKVLRDFGFMG